ncbi:heterokaryon incompatibility protein-domain-containing protein [Xylaria telfairii]|nr:heterokaryon incompatibility protein-domain-containing protein [Xylaria telfairii]
MRLLHLDSNGELSLTKDLTNNLPRYAILSHTWGDDEDEVLFEDIVNRSAKDKVGYRKIRSFMDWTIKYGLEFAWADTCCIKKSDSSELTMLAGVGTWLGPCDTMAINSMFRWYKDARVCYVHLADVSYDRYIHDDTSDDAFQTSRWFTRGWTLQELIAPRQVVFFSSDGSYLGCKDTIQRILVKITGIPGCALAGCDLSEFTVAERMSWASARETKLEEDRVYSLLGLFDIHLPPIYGEGSYTFMRSKLSVSPPHTPMMILVFHGRTQYRVMRKI